MQAAEARARFPTYCLGTELEPCSADPLLVGPEKNTLKSSFTLGMIDESTLLAAYSGMNGAQNTLEYTGYDDLALQFVALSRTNSSQVDISFRCDPDPTGIYFVKVVAFCGLAGKQHTFKHELM